MERVKNIYQLLPILILIFTTPTNLSLVTKSERSLKTGDTFTPAEMLPVAVRLIQKVEEPGLGKGIVSASRNAEDLADKLYEAFFMTPKRFVTLQEFDISGLDALQALALSGEVASNVESVTTANIETANMEQMNLRGQLVDINNEAKKCKYKLLVKKIEKNAERRGIALAKKLNKKRRLIVKSRKDFKETKNKVSTLEKTAAEEKRTKEPPCRWRYECSNPGDLDSCQLHTQCIGHNVTMATADYIGGDENDTDQKYSLRLFRKMLGLSVVDEEVEKILETRILYLKPSNLGDNERVESLGEYFNKIIMAQSFTEATTAPVPNVAKTQPDRSVESTESIINGENSQNEDINASVQGSSNSKPTRRQF